MGAAEGPDAAVPHRGDGAAALEDGQDADERRVPCGDGLREIVTASFDTVGAAPGGRPHRTERQRAGVMPAFSMYARRGQAQGPAPTLRRAPFISLCRSWPPGPAFLHPECPVSSRLPGCRPA